MSGPAAPRASALRPPRALAVAAMLLAPQIATPARAGAQVTALGALRFGTIVTGTQTSVAPTAAGAGVWRLRGILGVATQLTFTLPTALSRVGGGSMPISFCSTCAVYRVNNVNPAGGTTFNPHVGLHGLIIVVVSDVYLWLGGAVDPPLGQQPGSYVGTVVLTVANLI